MFVAKFYSIKDWERYVDLKRELIELKEERFNLQSGVFELRKSLRKEVENREYLEGEISKLGRLNIVGQLAASLGHEVRNPMTTIRGFLQMLQSKTDLLAYKNYFELMIEELDRANLIITNFLSLAKNNKSEVKRLNLNNLLDNLSPLLIADAYSQDKKYFFQPGNIEEIDIDSNEITQMVLNLARNGLEAMAPNGCLTIQTYMDDYSIVLSVRDEGKGINEENLKKLGDPFFTTKENGTGLGLPLCYRIAKRHRAIIEVFTGKDGTTFLVRFPKLSEN
ncbi:signal transduction histidine kinase [Desulfosporosinus acidiphilus SJ4]|uniref:histidine kinase n=1 Tax=Desulfosporosinus acidiphilus (strain DSM 22704 / JCM 16185 / SJ4) TaxID=646529 RepID=I4D4H7_DESAJ|nr:ATP-binding protein [Desulfosporosinus acidiphilus]AFM40701.1 signal transduction histidine kinase [Desulfosporosinus acidiphilus SJ4]